MIKPTIGRRVWYWPSAADLIREVSGCTMCSIDDSQPFDAGIVFVWGDRMVNLAVTDHRGVTHIRTSVQLLQDDDKPCGGGYAQWMPYQVKSAERPGSLSEAVFSLPLGASISLAVQPPPAHMAEPGIHAVQSYLAAQPLPDLQRDGVFYGDITGCPGTFTGADISANH